MILYRPKLLILALDGFDPALFLKWRDRLPTLSEWANNGFFTPISSTRPPMTFPAWSTFLTGVNPGKHGIFDFTERVPGQLRCRFINATRRRRPTFLKIASDQGLKVGAVGIPCTYPPEKLSGFQISGFDTPLPSKTNSSYVYPEELAKKIEQKLGGIYFGNFNESRINRGWHRRVLSKLLSGINRKIELVRFLLQEYSLDILVLHVGETDTVGHHFWCFTDPKSPRYVPTEDAAVADAIFRVYQAADRLASEVYHIFQPTSTLVVSDHGMTGTSDRILYLNRYLEQFGLLKFNNNTAVAPLISGLKKWGMKSVPYPLQQSLFRWAGGSLVSGIESSQRFGSIDWDKTLAYSEELNYYPAIYLNLKGREPCGIVDPTDAHQIVDRIIAVLSQWYDPISGSLIVRQTIKRKEIYHGTEASYAPDLILELARPNGYVYALGRSASLLGQQPFRQMRPKEYVGYKGASMNGSHLPLGTLIACGVGFNLTARTENSLQDIAPTILDLCGLEIPSWMDGSSLLGSKSAIESVPIESENINYYSSAEEAQLYAKLLELGYLE